MGNTGSLAVGENVAINVRAPAEVVKAWLQSDSHRAVLFHPEYQEVGIGFLLNARRRVWVADFGSTGEEPAGTPDRCHPWSGPGGGRS